MRGPFRLKREYLKEEEKDIRLSGLIYRFLGVNLALKVKNTGITPNQLTVISLIFGILSALSFFIGNYRCLIFGALLYQISVILDYSDGSLARLKGMTSFSGKWLDCNFDALRELLIIFGICWGLYNQTGNSMVWILGFILCGLNFMLDIQIMTFETFPFAKQGIGDFAPKSKLYEIGKHFICVRTIRYLAIIFFAITNQMFIFLALFSIYDALVVLLMAFSLGRVVKQNDTAG